MNYLLYLAILPSILLGIYIYKNDKIEKEPINLLLRCFIGGIVTALLVITICMIFPYEIDNTTLSKFYYIFVRIALLEESIKFIITYLICFKNREFNYLYDGICYASFLSLGFATLENVLYVVTNQSLLLAIARSIATVPAHVFFAIFMGYYLGIAKYYKSERKDKESNINLIKAIIIPTILHGFFDLCLYANNSITTILFIIFVILLYYLSFKKVKEMGTIRKSLYEK